MTAPRRLRRRWWIGAGIVLAAAAAAIVSASAATSTSAPLHFWIRTGEPKHRLFDAQDGREIGGWTAVWPRDAVMKPDGLEVVEETSVVRRTLARAGLVKLLDRTLLVRFAPTPDPSPAWRECFACIAGWPGDSVVDPALVGEWDEVGAASRSLHELRADGEVVRSWTHREHYRWGRVGDVLVFGLGQGAWLPAAAWGPVEISVLAPDGRSFRTPDGQVISKLQR